MVGQESEARLMTFFDGTLCGPMIYTKFEHCATTRNSSATNRPSQSSNFVRTVFYLWSGTLSARNSTIVRGLEMEQVPTAQDIVRTLLAQLSGTLSIQKAILDAVNKMAENLSTDPFPTPTARGATLRCDFIATRIFRR